MNYNFQDSNKEEAVERLLVTYLRLIQVTKHRLDNVRSMHRIVIGVRKVVTGLNQRYSKNSLNAVRK